jgi:hypothetical protein
MVYTHNLKLLLTNKDMDVVPDGVFLQEIKNILRERITHKIYWNNQNIDFPIQWDFIQLPYIDTHFMGDLFANPLYEIDDVISKHTKQTIENFLKNHDKNIYNVHFYISRIAGDKHIIINSFSTGEPVLTNNFLLEEPDEIEPDEIPLTKKRFVVSKKKI